MKGLKDKKTKLALLIKFMQLKTKILCTKLSSK